MAEEKIMPVPVVIADEQTPVPVVISEVEKPLPVITPTGNLSMPPTTTEQEDIVTAGQRRVNLVWEFTQAAIAIMVTVGMILIPIIRIENSTLENAFFLIVGFYFSRTNHTAIGGVGRKPSQPSYTGR